MYIFMSGCEIQVDRQHEIQMDSLERKRRHNIQHADTLQQEMALSFQELEALVSEGRNSILQEHARQCKVRCESKGESRSSGAPLSGSLP